MGSTNMQILCKCIFSVAVTTLFAIFFSFPFCVYCVCVREAVCVCAREREFVLFNSS